MKQHGIGVGYRYSHDFEGADVEQQYLPDALVGRRYYLPTDQGYEATIAARMTARAEARAAAKAAGRTQRSTMAAPGGRSRTPATTIMKTREENRKKLADTEKRDAGSDPEVGGLVVERPDVHYARAADGAHIAYQAFGTGRYDIVFMLGQHHATST